MSDSVLNKSLKTMSKTHTGFSMKISVCTMQQISDTAQKMKFSIKNLFSRCNRHLQLHKKWRSPLKIFSVNVTKSAVSRRFGHIWWINPWWQTSSFVQRATFRFSIFIKQKVIKFCTFWSKKYQIWKTLVGNLKI